MGKSTIFILASTLCLLSFFRNAYSEGNKVDELVVQGSVYCDTCNVQFITRLSEPMPGATVRLVCKDIDNPSNITLSEEAKTDENGKYSIKVDGDHAEEDCEVQPVKSSREDCAEWDESKHKQQGAKLSITNDNGIIQAQVRVANGLGFLRKQPLPECPQVLKELGLNPDGTLIN